MAEPKQARFLTFCPSIPCSGLFVFPFFFSQDTISSKALVSLALQLLPLALCRPTSHASARPRETFFFDVS